jgi:hypothetical protein
VKKLIITIFFLLFQVFSGDKIKAQDSLIIYDTIHLLRLDDYRYDYSLEDSIINKISIQASAAIQMNDVHFKLGGSLLGGAFTLATGIGIPGSKPVDWYLPCTIRTNNPKLDWISDVYCPGYIEKQRTRVTNSDGSKSVETSYENVFSWQNGALGYIIEAGDTVGWHYVIRFPRTDSSLIAWRQIVYKGQTEHKTINYMEFALLGEFLGKKSTLIFNSDDNRLYIFDQYDLKGIYQITKPPSPLVRKKKRIVVQPYLLVKENLTGYERMDVLRLAMIGLRMKSAIVSY